MPLTFFALCVATTCATSLNAQSGSSTDTTVCAIASHPEKFDGQPVKVSARVFSDGLHGSMLYDEFCGHYGILLFLVPDAKGGDQLDAALSWCHRGTRGKSISGTFTGLFHFKPVYIGDQARPAISVQRIDDLVLKSTKTASASFPTPCPDAPPLDTLVHASGKDSGRN